MKISVKGGGVAGLTAGIAALLRGFDVEIHEKNKSFREVGAGLQLSPNAIHILNALGVDLQNTFQPVNLEMYTGEEKEKIFLLPIKDIAPARYDAEYLHIARSDLQNALITRFLSLGGNIEFSSSPDNLVGDLIVHADGVHSNFLEKHVDALKDYSGYVAWRFIIPVAHAQFVPPASAVVWTGKEKHMVTTRIEGGEVINCVAIHKARNTENSWYQSAPTTELLAHFDDFHSDLKSLLTHHEEALYWPLSSRKVPAKWHYGNEIAIGDAVHSMLPSYSQGAGQAIEDAYLLLAMLGDNIEESLQKFTHFRNARVRKVMKISVKNMNAFHHKGALRFVQNQILRTTSLFWPNALHRRNDWLYKKNYPKEFPLKSSN